MRLFVLVCMYAIFEHIFYFILSLSLYRYIYICACLENFSFFLTLDDLFIQMIVSMICATS